MKTLWIIILTAFIIIGGFLYIRGRNMDNVTSVNNNSTTTTTVINNSTTTPPVNTATSTPGQTATSDITITSPLRNQIVTSPLTLTGSARGSWYFEASAPVLLTDSNGKTLAQSHIEAQGDWMTTNFVPFKGTLSFTRAQIGTTTSGYIVFQNDNPSGNPALQKSVRVPVIFSN